MKISALRLPIAFAACFAVVLAGAPGASATPPAPDAAAATVAGTARPDPVDDAFTAPIGTTALVDVLANDRLEEPTTVRLLLVDPAADEAGDELRTDLGFLRVVSSAPDTGSLPEDRDVPGHPVLVLTPAPDLPDDAPSVQVAYAVVGATGAEDRALLTVTPEPVGEASPGVSADPATSADTTTSEEPTTSAEPTVSDGPTSGAEPAEDRAPGPESAEELPIAPEADEQDPVTAAPEDATEVPTEVREALEAAAARESARTGGPTGGMRPWAGGWEWPHENGPVLWTAAHGAHYVHTGGEVGQRWSAAGGADGLGAPVSDEVCGMVGDGCRQTYSGGSSIYWSPATGAKLVRLQGAIGKRWGQQRWERGALGYPVGDEVCGMVGGGCRQAFANGTSIYWSPATGAKLVRLQGAIGKRWGQQRWERGALGYPVGDEVCGMVGGGCRQAFANGTSIYWSPATGAKLVRLQGA
ncbi:hypothetical protein ACH9DO_12025, partial [Kocuria sp. M1N1S27]